MLKTVSAAALLLIAISSGALAQDGSDVQASADEVAKVNEAIAKVGCKAAEVEKEKDDLFEIDDAQCEIGQYDIKLNSDYKITVMTAD